MTSTHKPSVAVWITVALVAVLVYVGSLGPWIAFYVAMHRHQSEIVVPFGLYRPIEFVAINSPAKSAYDRYVGWWATLGENMRP